MTTDGVGHGRPPRHSRYPKGTSGNLAGRPRGRHRLAPYEAVLGQVVKVVREGVVQEMSAAEAFILHLTKKAMEGDIVASTRVLSKIDAYRDVADLGQTRDTIIVCFGRPCAIELLGMGRTLDPDRADARQLLEPWIVELALARLGDRRLTLDEQQIIVEATRTPHKVTFPDWWIARPRGKPSQRMKRPRELTPGEEAMADHQTDRRKKR